MPVIDFTTEGDNGGYQPAPSGDPYGKVRSIYQQITGGSYNPSQQDVSQWGSNIDSAYENKIRGAVSNWWTDYQRQQKPPAAPPPTTPPPPAEQTKPSGGNLRDPAYVDQLLAWWAKQPGVNPSVINDPNYWRQKILSGELGTDENYITQRFMTPEGAPANRGTGGTTTSIPGLGIPGMDSQFSDPTTKNLENWINSRLSELNQPVNDPSRAALAALLDEQTKQFQAQRAAQEQANAALAARQAEAMKSADEFVNYARQRAQKLQGPAYTGAESEVLRTQALDPIEADRQAAQQRALQNISARGMDPTSGIAQQLLNDVNASFDRSRAGAQNQLAYNTINEQRSREQEAQQLLGYIPQAQSAAAQGDLEFVQSLNNALNQLEQGSIASAGQSAALGQQTRNEEQARRQEALSLAAMLQQLPTTALQQSMAAIGMGPSPESLANTAISLYGIGQQQRNQGLSWYQTLGMALPYLSGMFGGGGTGTGGYGGFYNYSGGG